VYGRQFRNNLAALLLQLLQLETQRILKKISPSAVAHRCRLTLLPGRVGQSGREGGVEVACAVALGGD